MIKFLKQFINQFKEYILLIFLIVVSLSFISSSEKPQIKKIRTFALGNFAFVSDVLNSVLDIFKYDESKEKLKLENARLMLELNKLRNQESENEELRAKLFMKDTSKLQLVTADVISKHVNKLQGFFTINKGLEDEIEIGMPVIDQKGLVGIISNVTPNFSLIRTLFNSNLNIAVTIQRINVDGVLSWDGSELVIKNIPTTYDVRVGDIIETSDFSMLFPPNVPVGIISKKESLMLGLLHTISIQPFSKIESVHGVFIVKQAMSKQINNLEMNLIK
ncbi:MAG: rod shape-determining protein MreC [Ignavibacteria bacterium]|nr:rod shape-determining protein MreC [Ignavibacteria bacterium]